MGEDLRRALEEIRFATESTSNDDIVDSKLHEQKLRQKLRPSQDEIRKELEAEFLTPSKVFSSEWLNQLQQRWDAPPDYTNLLEIAPTQTRTITRFNREGLEGRVTGYVEVTVPASSATAKNSTSILRKPANRADFVRGAAGFLPFAPGGLDAIEAAAAIEDQPIPAQASDQAVPPKNALDRVIDFGSEGGLLETPPGFSRGLKFSKAPSKRAQEDAEDIERTLGSNEEQNINVVPSSKSNSGEILKDLNGQESADEDDIDSLLPIEFPALEPRGKLTQPAARRFDRQWAHMVDINRDITNFREIVPDMAKEWPFELDTFQKEAVYHLENGDSVFVAAHTSAGKTVVAEYAIALAAKHMTKAIYTSPIKALSNQKFRDFRQIFEDVGILTGDVQIRPEASCLIMTTEILRSMLYRGADLIRDVEFVIFDEVHYVNDLERGVVWEEVIIMLPEHVTLILLSATVPNTYEFASWVGRTKKKDIYVISTPKRPVPLEHYLWAGKGMYKIVDADKKFLDNGWKEASDIISGRDKIKTPLAHEQAANQSKGANQRGGNRGNNQRTGSRGQTRRGDSTRGTRGHSNRGPGGGNIARAGRGGMYTSAAQDRNTWVHLVQHLRKEDLLPACIFVFSKKRCELNADSLSNLDYCTAAEKSAIHMILEKSLARLKQEDRQLPQIRRLRELLSRGIAVHHGGLLPIVKECVEILFAKTLVKVLFATETFAMGLNLPTRTVVFSGYRKHDGHEFRDLLPGEYTQMAGRAGRRGLDPVGSVIIHSNRDEAPSVSTLKQMILGEPTKLRSQFRLSYNMILNLLRVEALKIEEMIKRSFSENATQALLPEQEKQIKSSEADLARIKRATCNICDADLDSVHQASIDYSRLTTELHIGLMASPVGRRMCCPKRLVVFVDNGTRAAGLLVREPTSKGANSSAHILELATTVEKRQTGDMLPYLPAFRSYFTELSETLEARLRVVEVPLSEVECFTNTISKVQMSLSQFRKDKGIETSTINMLSMLRNDVDAVRELQEEASKFIRRWEAPEWDELDWNRVKELQLRETLEKRQKAVAVAQDATCLSCPEFPKHFATRHNEWLIQENISQLKQLMSDQNLLLLPDYEQRIAVLKELHFIDENSRIELKGKVACEIHSADELILTELILENIFAEFDPEEIVALLSAFVFQEKTDNIPTLTPSLERGRDIIIEISEKVNAFQTQYQVILSSEDSNDFVSRPRFGLVEVVYEWARGMSFNRITDLTDVLEGTIVRVITRLDETCREVKNAARIVGDPTLFTKMQECQEMIKRDVTAVASL
ncbi:MAG: hypothetical protein M1824_003242 [Vezdaea acicularis]|nr:MAG: hypothetical protein M1824_003242 [Vezdaea acicularis]